VIPVDQTIMGSHRPPYGNCLQAALASLTELPLEECPHLAGREDWWEELSRWAAGAGYNLLAGVGAEAPEGWSLAVGESPRGFSHVCVYRDGQLAHDPHPSRAGLASVKEYWLLWPVNEPVAASR
jgi:hypothetical protein